jgi:hypothetical protein
MNKKLLITIISGVIALSASITLVLIPSKYQNINEAFTNIISFNEAETNKTIKIGDEIVFEENITFTKQDNIVKFKSVKTELSDDLAADNLMTTTTTNSQFSLDVIHEYLPTKFSISDESVVDFRKINDGYTFIITANYLKDVFGLDDVDSQSITDEGVLVEIIIQEKMVVSYKCSYKTVSGMQVVLTTIIK